jgi:Mitotic-spindle organizing gamma-tubulin ring associated
MLQIVREISNRLDTGLPPAALEAIIDLLRQGVHPDAIVAVIESVSA